MYTIDSVWVAATEIQIENLGEEVDSLQYSLQMLQDKTDLLMSIVEVSNGSVSKQLAAAGYLLALIALLITIASIFLGLYIRRKKIEIETIGKTVEEEKSSVKSMVKATKELDKQINGNLTALYNKLRVEETNSLLERLVLEPRDISNLLPLLFARDMDECSFPTLRKAYLNLIDAKESDNNEVDSYHNSIDTYVQSYMMSFFQHFCYQAVEDDIIRPEFISHFGLSCNQSFKRDIIKSTIDFCKALSDNNATFNKEDALVAYLKALNSSKHKDYEELKNILEQNISSKELITLAIERCKNEGVYITLFGIVAPDKTQFETSE